MSIRSAGPGAATLWIPATLSRALEAAWKRGLFTEPTLDSGALIDAAAAHEGERPEDGSWREALDVLTADIREKADLNALGRTIAHGQLVGILRQRIRAAALWARHPEVLDDPLPTPVIILGQMRSGTTRLQRLLACDPRFSYTRLHESLVPFGARPGAMASAAVVRSLLGACNSALRTIHPSSPNAPEEEFGLHAFSFHGTLFEAQWRVPKFARWDECRDQGPVYQEFRRLVQTLRWRRGERQASIQLLKAPQFMQELDAVLEVFPDARLIWIERDAREVVASSASLVWNQQRVQSPTADPLQIGREWLRKTRLRQTRATEASRRHPSVPLLRVSYLAMNSDWRAEMARIYEFLGLELPASLLAKMSAVAASGAHKGHRYSLEQFGVDRRAATNA